MLFGTPEVLARFICLGKFSVLQTKEMSGEREMSVLKKKVFNPFLARFVSSCQASWKDAAQHYTIFLLVGHISHLYHPLPHQFTLSLKPCFWNAGPHLSNNTSTLCLKVKCLSVLQLKLNVS